MVTAKAQLSLLQGLLKSSAGFLTMSAFSTPNRSGWSLGLDCELPSLLPCKEGASMRGAHGHLPAWAAGRR